MKIFLTGATGILGSDISIQAKNAGHEVAEFNSGNINLGDFADVKSKISAFKPDWVIHCAAMTNVDLCEDEKELATLINVTGSGNIALAADEAGAAIVYISSCGVYGNSSTQPYSETDEKNPLTFHHLTKLQGEAAVMKCNPKYLIVRPGWLFGGTVAHKKNFVEARRREAEKAAVISSAADKKGSPTYTSDLAAQILHLVKNNQLGVFNMVNEGCASRFEYVKEIVSNLRLNTVVEPVNSNAFPRKANMPDNECLANSALNQHGLNMMRDWKAALKEYITNTYQQ